MNQMLLACAVILGLTCVHGSHSTSATDSSTAACPPKYPKAELKEFCSRIPKWCDRIRHHSGSSWHGCKRRCQNYLQFGRYRYRVESTAMNAKLQLFRLAMHAWRQCAMTIWGSKVYTLCGGKRSWQMVYQLDGGRLTAADIGAKPPYRCAETTNHSVGGSGGKRSDKGGHGRRLHHAQGTCSGGRCSVHLSARHLVKEIERLCRQNRGGCSMAELVFVLDIKGGRARLASLYVRGPTARSQHREDVDDPSARYHKFLDRRRQNYWHREGWRGNEAEQGRGKHVSKNHQSQKSHHSQRDKSIKATHGSGNEDKELKENLNEFLKDS